MALTPIRIDRTSKPPLGTPLRSDGHWSVNGLVGAWAFNEGAGKSAINGYKSDIAILGPNTVLYADGLRTAAGYTFCVSNYGLGIAAEITYICGVRIHASTGVPQGIISVSSGGPYLRLTADYKVNILKSRVADIGTGATGISIGSWCTLAATVKGADWAVYINGKLDGSGGGAPSFSSTDPLRFGCDLESTENANATIQFAYPYLRALTPNQVASISVNPWQIYEPETIWVDVPATGGTTITSSIDSLIQKTLTAATSTDAYIQKLFITPVSLDSLIQAVKSGSLSLDALTQILSTRAVSTDALLQAVKMNVISADALLFSIFSSSSVIDAILQSSGGLPYVMTDAILQATKSTGFDVDALVQKLLSSTLSLDSILFYVNVTQISFDSLIQAVKFYNINFDALILLTKNLTVSLDSFLYSTKTLGISTDAILTMLGSNSVAIEAILYLTQRFNVSLDAIIGTLILYSHKTFVVPTRTKSFVAPTRIKTYYT